MFMCSSLINQTELHKDVYKGAKLVLHCPPSEPFICILVSLRNLLVLWDVGVNLKLQ